MYQHRIDQYKLFSRYVVIRDGGFPYYKNSTPILAQRLTLVVAYQMAHIPNATENKRSKEFGDGRVEIEPADEAQTIGKGEEQCDWIKVSSGNSC